MVAAYREATFAAVRCECGEVLLDGRFTGVVRIKCPRCRQRQWIGGKDGRLRIVLTDKPAKKVLT